MEKRNSELLTPVALEIHLTYPESLQKIPLFFPIPLAPHFVGILFQPADQALVVNAGFLAEIDLRKALLVAGQSIQDVLQQNCGVSSLPFTTLARNGSFR